MEIKIKTIYGNVNLRSCYDCDSSSDFYDAYDDNDHHLGELWNLPYYDEDDEESMECLKVALETAIECNDICAPRNMTQREIIKYYNENGGLRCKSWTIKEIKEYIKADLGQLQRVNKTTCYELKRTAEIFQR